MFRVKYLGYTEQSIDAVQNQMNAQSVHRNEGDVEGLWRPVKELFSVADGRRGLQS